MRPEISPRSFRGNINNCLRVPAAFLLAGSMYLSQTERAYSDDPTPSSENGHTLQIPYLSKDGAGFDMREGMPYRLIANGVESNGIAPPPEPPIEVAPVEEPPPIYEPPIVDSNDYIWDLLAECESSGNWQINTGNGYYGGIQADMTFWIRYGGLEFAPRPDLASREAQIIIGKRGLDVQGWGAWPSCSAQLGLR